MKQKAFSVVELVIVMAIIGILVSIASVSYIGLQKRTRDDEREADARIVMTALDNYYEREGMYPSYAEFYERSDYSSVQGFKEKKLNLNPAVLTNPSDKNVVANFRYSSSYNWNNIYSYYWYYPGNSESEVLSKVNSKSYPTSNNKYYYLPIDSNVCWVYSNSSPCIKAIISWKSEVDGQVHVLKSKYGW